MKVCWLKNFVAWFSIVGSSVVSADQYHYNNIIVGDRAMGLAGAYTAIADDASGVVYNPAGLGFALSNDVSGSANAFYQKRVEYKNIIGSKSYVESSRGMFNPFFGGLQKLDNIMNGLVFAFGLYSSDAELKDQDDLISASDLGIERFHRSANIRASTNYFGIGFGKRLGRGISLGLGANAVWVDELTQIYQDSILGPRTSNGTTFYSLTARADRQQLKVQGVEPVLGVQVALMDKFSFGLVYKQAILMKDTMKVGQEQTVQGISAVKSTEGVKSTYTPLSDVERSILDTEVEDAIGNWPYELRFGAAWFASTRFLLSFDFTQRGATEGKFDALDRLAVNNFALGSEIYLTASMPLRLGLFTNNDARPEVSSTKTNQDDHVDYTGGSIFLGWVQPNSQISVGTIYQQGKGKSQKISGSTAIQDVVAVSTTVGISATHNF